MDNATRIAHYGPRLTPAQRRRVTKHDRRAMSRGEHAHEPPARPCLKCHPELRLTDGPVRHHHGPPAHRCPVCRPPSLRWSADGAAPWRPV